MNQKHLILRIEDVERELVSTVNNLVRDNDLPFYFLEPIIDRIHKQIIDERNRELEILRANEKTENVEAS